MITIVSSTLRRLTPTSSQSRRAPRSDASSRTRALRAVAMGSLMLAAVGCGDDGPALRDAGDDASVVVKTHGRVLGQVFRADTLQPVADVKIPGPHSVTATSDAQG